MSIKLTAINGRSRFFISNIVRSHREYQSSFYSWHGVRRSSTAEDYNKSSAQKKHARWWWYYPVLFVRITSLLTVRFVLSYTHTYIYIYTRTHILTRYSIIPEMWSDRDLLLYQWWMACRRIKIGRGRKDSESTTTHTKREEDETKTYTIRTRKKRKQLCTIYIVPTTKTTRNYTFKVYNKYYVINSTISTLQYVTNKHKHGIFQTVILSRTNIRITNQYYS